MDYKSWNAKTKEWYVPNNAAPLKLLGNTGDLIDWNKVILGISDKEGVVLPKLIWPNPHFEEMKRLYVDSNYIMDSAEWINYYPIIDYEEEINNAFGQFVGKPKYVRAWISRINPGKTAPWHWDLDDGEEEYLKGGDLLRYTCRISTAGVGQVSIVGDTAIHGGPAGDVYLWPDHRMWHGSVNAGLTPKYQFNYLAYV